MDFRQQCAKFLSAECPNNCHYDDWCKHIKAAEDMFTLCHNDRGLDEEEINDLISESTYTQRVKWLIQQGFELGRM